MAKRPRDSVEREIMDIIPERFDADSGSMGARRGAHTRLILTIALGLLALAAIGIVARVLLVGEGQQIAADATVPVIKPDDKPIKTKPEDRGGMAVPNQDKLVYKDVGKDETPAEPEKLMPPAEKPQVPAAKPGAAIPAPPAAGASSDMPAPPPAAASSDSSTTTAPAAPAATPAAPAPSPTSADTKKADTAPAAATPAPAAGRAPVKTTAVASAAPPPAPAPAAPAAKPPATAASTGGGAYQVQLAAMKSEAEAQAAWKKASTANKDLLGNLTDEIVKADLGAKGIYYRLRAGPLDEAAAKSLCAELAKRNQGCLVARK